MATEVKNPKLNAVVPVTAGQVTTIVLACSNETGEEFKFDLDLTGPNWVTGSTLDERIPDAGLVKFILTCLPPTTVPPTKVEAKIRYGEQVYQQFAFQLADATEAQPNPIGSGNGTSGGTSVPDGTSPQYGFEGDDTASGASDLPDDPEGILFYDGIEIELQEGESKNIYFPLEAEHEDARWHKIDVVGQGSAFFGFKNRRANVGMGDRGAHLKGVVDIPAETLPERYEFTVRLGPEPIDSDHDGRPTYTGTLIVIPTPRVALVEGGPAIFRGSVRRGCYPTITIGVVNAGRCPTAYRLAVKKTGGSGRRSVARFGEEDQYGQAPWDYTFDSEFGEFEKGATGNSVEIETHHLTVRRRGWTWRIIDRHSVLVEVVPVTDVTNGNHRLNTRTYVAEHRRLGSLFLLMATCAFFVLALGGATIVGLRDVRVKGSLRGDDGFDYLIQAKDTSWQPSDLEQVKMPVVLDWKAPAWFPVVVTDTRTQEAQRVWRSSTATMNADIGGRHDAMKGYSVTPRFSFGLGAIETPPIRFVPMRTRGMFVPQAFSSQRVPLERGGWTNKVVAKPGQLTELHIHVPAGQDIDLGMVNQSRDRKIHLWPLRLPSWYTDGFGRGGATELLENGHRIEEIEKQSISVAAKIALLPYSVIKLRFQGQTPPPDEELVFATSDADAQIVRIRVRP